jgi:hypothetical protein
MSADIALVSLFVILVVALEVQIIKITKRIDQLTGGPAGK